MITRPFLRYDSMTFRPWWARVTTPDVWPHRWQDRLFCGHLHIGPVTIYGANAMLRSTRDRVEAYSSGVRAFQAGVDQQNNPYTDDGKLAARWLSGWKSAEATSIEQAPRVDGGKPGEKK